MPAVPAVALVMALLAALVLCFFGEFRLVFEQWRTDPYETHGMLLAALVPVLIWLRRNRLGVTTGHRNHAAVALFLTTVAIAFFHSASVDTAVWLLLPCVAILAIATTCGWRAASELALPIGYFALALPIWERAAPPLQWFTTHATASALRVADIEATIYTMTFSPYPAVPLK
jgi:hypothetical protein